MAIPLETPVVLLLFNRPAETNRVFELVRRAQPKKLLLVADGPRGHVASDEPSTRAARAVVERIDWDCVVVRDYADANMGLGRRVASGLDHAFSLYEEAIVLEDDTVPDDSFFGFCHSLLARYRENPRVMMVCGTNNLVSWKADRQDYHFSVYGSVWGWATWRRAWRHYDYDLRSLDEPEARARVSAMLDDPQQFDYRLRVCKEVTTGRIDTWDYQWTWSRLLAGGLAAVSAVNLVSNIGFGANATHTRRFDPDNALLVRQSATHSLRSPTGIEPDREYDRRLFERVSGAMGAQATLHQGIQLLDAGRNIHALMCFQRALGLGIDPSQVLFHQASAYISLGRNDHAAQALRQLLSLNPEHRDASSLLARLHPLSDG